MPYELSQDESFDKGLKRIALEEAELAVRQLEHAGENMLNAIHDSRNNVKRLRALLRLIRFEFEVNAFEREDQHFRDTGRLISDIRDAQVAVETFDILTERFPELKAGNGFSWLRKKLQDLEQKVIARKTGKEQVIQKAIRKLSQTPKRIKNWPVVPEVPSVILRGLEGVYIKGQNALEAARQTPGKEHFHDWRKQVKYHWNHYCLLNRLLPGELRGQGESVHTLSDYLGLEHDLANFEGVIAETDIQNVLGKKTPELEKCITSHRDELQHNSIELGSEIYSKSADGFVKAFEGIWNAKK